jgi:hypothetical protein
VLDYLAFADEGRRGERGQHQLADQVVGQEAFGDVRAVQ